MSNQEGAPRGVRGGTAIATSIGLMNVTTYLYTIIAARGLGPKSYGAFAALMGVMLVVSVLSLGLQATAARRIAAEPEHVAEIETAILSVTYRMSVALGVLCLALTPIINLALRLDSLPTAALVALCAVPLTVMGSQAGILQGERRWTALSWLYLAAGVPRLLLGSMLIIWRPTEFSAMLGVALTAFAPAIFGWFALRNPRAHGIPSGDHTGRAVLVETAHNSHALLAFFALSNADVIMARIVLDGHEAGLYAGGLIVVKAVLFFPQFVVVLAFPSMASQTARRDALLKSLLLVGVIGMLAAAGTAVLSALAVIFVGGEQYSEIQHQLWQFAILGTLLAGLQLLVYGVLARQAKKSVFLIWAALLVIVGFGQLIDSYAELLRLACAVNLGLFLALLVVSLRNLPRRTTDAEQVSTV